MNEFLKHIKDHWISSILLVASAVLYFTGDKENGAYVFCSAIMIYAIVE